MRALPAPACAVLLCLIAGYVDAIGYLDYEHVFAANMTGNTVLLAISLAEQEWWRIAPYGLTLASFLAGALMAEAVKRHGLRPAIPLLASGVPLVILVMADVRGNSALVLLAFGMGLQGGSVSRFADVNVQTVVITGTILRLAEATMFRLVPGRGDRRPAPPRLALPVFAFSWIAYAVGAGLSLGAKELGPMKLLLPLLVLIPVAISENRER
ncbi:MAG TPA: YoaK family protein [Alphaproteobacteria bacterium]